MIDIQPVSQNGNGAHHQNGGRAVPALPTFTFPYSGYVVQCRKMSQATDKLLQRRVEKERPKPTPPVQEIPQPNGPAEFEENTLDPQYTAALAEWNAWAQRRKGELTYDYIRDHCLIVEMSDADRAEVERIKAEFADELTDVDTDRVLFIEHLVMPLKGDINALFQFVISESAPTEEAVQAHVETFRGHV